MKSVRLFLVLVVTAWLGNIAGCDSKPAVASPRCVELDKTTDPVRRAELQKQCPRGGKFQRSPAVNW
jgi:entry exclusion lipoprotein TrbK